MLDTAEPDRLNDIWHDVQTIAGRKNLGARLFNVSSRPKASKKIRRFRRRTKTALASI